jgi:hypothetical protein
VRVVCIDENSHPRITVHFLPTSGSSLNMVEIFGCISRQAIRRGSFDSPRTRRCHPPPFDD